MKGFDNKFIEELKEKNDIVDVARKYMQLTQRGNDFWGCCPFHHEKTPSFCVHRVEQYYHCFGCHKSGNVISLVMELESLDFIDAIKFLADRVNMPLPEIRYDDEKVKEQKQRKERILSLLRDTALFYVGNLKKEGGVKHVEYILKRGLSAETVGKFGIGASLNYEDLPEYLKEKGYTEEEMVASGAVGSKNGRCYDALGGRLIIPTIDQFGNVIAFCGRVLIPQDNVGKYVNTRETSVFTKGKTLFNINNLKKLKNEQGIDSIIMVEGQMDVISLVQAGIKNVVASMGTAFTKDQARMLKRYAEKIYICYDGDSAGQKATLRGLDILSDEGLDIKVVSLPDGLDPDEVVKKLGEKAYRDCLVSASPLIDFKISVLKKSYDLNTTDGRRKFASQAIKVIKESPSATEQEDLLKAVQQDTRFTLDALKRELYSTESQLKATDEVIPEEEKTGTKTEMACRFVLASYLFNKPFAKNYDINEIKFDNPIHLEIKDYILKKKSEGVNPRFSELIDNVNDEDNLVKDELSMIASYDQDSGEKFNGQKYFDDCVKLIIKEDLDLSIERLTKLYKEETDPDKRRELAGSLSQILSKKNKLLK